MTTANVYCPLAVCLVAASLGILFAFHFPTSQALWYSSFAIGFLLWLALQIPFLRLNSPKNNSGISRARNGLNFLAMFAVASMVFTLFGQRYTQRMDLWLDTEEQIFHGSDDALVVAEAWLCSMPEMRMAHTPFLKSGDDLIEQTVFDAKLKQIRENDRWVDCPARVRVVIPGNHTTLQPGDRIRLWGKANRSSKPGNPNQFDYRFYMQSQGIIATVQIESPDGIVLEYPHEKFPVLRLLNNTRNELQSKFAHWIPKENCPLACAMVLGLRNDLDPEVKDMFRETGTMHILAISGMHVGLVTTMLFFVLKILLIPRQVVCILAMVFAIFYTIMTGGQPPAVRAALFLSIVFLGLFFSFRISPINTLAMTALGILFINPLRLFDVGVHLSFLAVGTFLWLPPVSLKKQNAKELASHSWITTLAQIPTSWEHRKKLAIEFALNSWSFVVQLFQYNILIWLILSPLILKLGNIVTPVAMLINPILWAPLWGATFLSFLLAGCNGHLAFLQPLIGVLTGFFYGFISGAINLAHQCPLGFFRMPSPPDWWLIIFYLPLVYWTLFPAICPSRRKIVLFMVLWGCFGSLHFYLQKAVVEQKESLEMVTFCVGHGNAILASFPDNRNVLYDCGSFSSPRSAGFVVAKYVLNRGKRQIDLLVLSHPDSDHYNAVEFLLELVDVHAVAVPPGMFLKQDENVQRLEKILRQKGIPVHHMKMGDSFDFASFPELTVLHPCTSPEETDYGGTGKQINSNAMSLVVMLEYHKRKVLLTGDLDAQNPAFLKQPPEKIDVLLAPHHGGRSCNTSDLVRWGDPDFIFISEGRFRTDRALVERIDTDDTRLLNTFRDGAIILNISKSAVQNGKGNLVVHSWRPQRPPVVIRPRPSAANGKRQMSTASEAAP